MIINKKRNYNNIISLFLPVYVKRVNYYKQKVFFNLRSHSYKGLYKMLYQLMNYCLSDFYNIHTHSNWISFHLNNL